MNDRAPVLMRCSAVVFSGEAVLLCRRDIDGVPAWVLPGGTPREAEGSASCVRREVLEETGVAIDADRVAFVLETTSPDRQHHLLEVVFLGTARHAPVAPVSNEPHLVPELVPLSEISSLALLPPMGGYVVGLAREQLRRDSTEYGTAAYLGNIWRPSADFKW